MRSTLIREIEPHISLHRDLATGIAWVENGRAGVAHSAHPNVQQGFYDIPPVGSRMISCRGFDYNTAMSVVSCQYDAVAARHCDCGGNHNIPPQFRLPKDKMPVTENVFIPKRQGKAGNLKWSSTKADGIIVRISGVSMSYQLDLIDERFEEAKDGVRYRVACSRTWDVLFGVYEFMRRAPAEVVLATLEQSIV